MTFTIAISTPNLHIQSRFSLKSTFGHRILEPIYSLPPPWCIELTWRQFSPHGCQSKIIPQKSVLIFHPWWGENAKFLHPWWGENEQNFPPMGVSFPPMVGGKFVSFLIYHHPWMQKFFDLTLRKIVDANRCVSFPPNMGEKTTYEVIILGWDAVAGHITSPVDRS